jgi:multicomponent K+:H+ antiporter subunit E
MRTLLARPYLSLALFVAWLLVNNSVSVGNLVLAAIFCIAIPAVLAPVAGDLPTNMGRWRSVLQLAWVVLYDIVMSNITVAKQVLGPEAKLNSRFVWVPLAVQDAHGIVALAGIITMTPGTLSADLTEDRRHLLVHALHVDDEAALIESIKQRYEAPLRVILGEVQS